MLIATAGAGGTFVLFVVVEPVAVLAEVEDDPAPQAEKHTVRKAIKNRGRCCFNYWEPHVADWDGRLRGSSMPQLWPELLMFTIRTRHVPGRGRRRGLDLDAGGAGGHGLIGCGTRSCLPGAGTRAVKRLANLQQLIAGMRELPNPRDLKNAVRLVIESNSADGYVPSRFIQATGDGTATDLLAVFRRLISKGETLQYLNSALKRISTLLTLEDFVSWRGAEWVSITQQSTSPVPALCTSTKWLGAPGTGFRGNR